MKKIFIILTSYALIALNRSTCLFAQNVGIGDPLPSAKLTISGNETTPNGQAASLKIINTASSNAWYLRAGAIGTNTPNNGFSIGDNVSNHFNMLSNGNLGLGLIPQSARLHVNGPIKIEGTNSFEFGAGIAGKELNAGKIGYNSFGSNALEIVGAGSNSTNRRVYFFAEGGTHFSGSVNVAGNLNTVGQLQVNGNSGLAGQVLTSNGTSDPSWTNTALSNNERFNASISFGTTGTSGFLSLTTDYNFGGANIVIGSNSVTINKAGLYHFDLFLNYACVNPTTNPLISVNIWPTNVTPLSDEVVTNRAASGMYKANWHFSFDLYVPAGRILQINTLYLESTGLHVMTGSFSGHLISE